MLSPLSEASTLGRSHFRCRSPRSLGLVLGQPLGEPPISRARPYGVNDGSRSVGAAKVLFSRHASFLCRSRTPQERDRSSGRWEAPLPAEGRLPRLGRPGPRSFASAPRCRGKWSGTPFEMGSLSIVQAKDQGQSMVNGARIVPPSRYFLEPDLADQIEPPGHGPHDTAESHGDLVVGTPGLRRDAKIVVEALFVRQDPDRLTVCRDRLRPLSLATQGNAALVGVLGPLPLEPLLEPEARQEDDAEGGVCRSRLQPAPRPPGGRRSGRGNLSGVTLHCQAGGRAGEGPAGASAEKGVYRIVGTLRGLRRPWERAVSLECTQIKSSSRGRQLPETAAREGEVPGRDIVAV